MSSRTPEMRRARLEETRADIQKIWNGILARKEWIYEPFPSLVVAVAVLQEVVAALEESVTKMEERSEEKPCS